MQIKDIMTRHVETIDIDATVREAARTMERDNLGFLPVLKEEVTVGVLTDRDIALRLVAAGRDPDRTRVGEIMTTGLAKPVHVDPETRGVESLPEDADVSEAVRLMADKGLHRVLVHDSEYEVVGVMSRDDLFARGAMTAVTTG